MIRNRDYQSNHVTRSVNYLSTWRCQSKYLFYNLKRELDQVHILAIAALPLTLATVVYCLRSSFNIPGLKSFPIRQHCICLQAGNDRIFFSIDKTAAASRLSNARLVRFFRRSKLFAIFVQTLPELSSMIFIPPKQLKNPAFMQINYFLNIL
ncbi:hypothetical protein ACO0LF_23530 [Undibacterium sp. Di27W]|uniref:hypothetical protein n=1 Tax=Undibacterium sp. Di27W TaxID=3413036 RepID=UPI003BF34250